MQKISIITPVLNEEDNIEDCYLSVKNYFKDKVFNYEHICVDNSSKDKSTIKIEKICQNDKKVKLIINNQNYGILPSLFNTLNYCDSNFTLVCYAADLQDPIDEFLDKALPFLENNYEIIYSIRNQREEGFIYKILKKTYYSLAKLLTRNKLKPNVNVFQLISDNVRKEILQSETNNPFIPYLLQDNSFKKVGIETRWIRRVKNSPKNNFWSLFDEAKNAILNYSGISSTLSFGLSILFFAFSSVFTIYNLFLFFMNILSDTLHVTSGIPSIIIFNSLSFSAIFIILAIISENINHLLKNKIGKKVRIKKKINFE